MNLNIKSLTNIFDKTNTSYKYLLFYSLIKIIKEKKNSEISFQEILSMVCKLAWFPVFQFKLKFRKQDQIKNLLEEIFFDCSDDIKKNNPTNKILKKIDEEIEKSLNNEKNYKKLNDIFFKYVLQRLIRPFYLPLKGVGESGPGGLPEVGYKIFESLQNFEKFKPIYFVKNENKKIIIHKEWMEYINNHYVFLELWTVNEWSKYMNLENPSYSNLNLKLKFPDLKRETLINSRNFWKKIIYKEDIKCIFSNRKLHLNNFHIDHYICWNYLGHDEIWNLIPITEEINMQKSDKIPKHEFIKKFISLKKYSLENVDLNDNYVEAHQNFVGSSISDLKFEEIYFKKIENLSNTAKLNGFEEWSFL